MAPASIQAKPEWVGFFLARRTASTGTASMGVEARRLTAKAAIVTNTVPGASSLSTKIYCQDVEPKKPNKIRLSHSSLILFYRLLYFFMFWNQVCDCIKSWDVQFASGYTPAMHTHFEIIRNTFPHIYLRTFKQSKKYLMNTDIKYE